jgi:arylsulfatase A-like enzyme
MVRRIVDGLQQVHAALSGALGLPVFSVPADLCWQLFAQNRKAAAVVNAEFLAWIRDREQPDRPFFAFLNYYDAHHPYQPAPAGIHRFGRGPASDRELAVIRDWAELVKQAPSEADVAFARDSYDDCVADLDERLGQLIDELETRGVLKNTWVIVTADHGESFGEHPGVFLHGATLYQTETHVPLLVIPPPRMAQTAQVAGPVSLRDLAATIVAIAGLEAGSPFPGTPLLKVSAPQALMTVDPRSKPSPALAELAHEIPPYSSSTAYDPLRWPLSSLVTEDWSYFRRDGNLRELLFDVTEDPKELKNRASDSEVDSTLSQMRATLLELTSGPLTPARFHP